MSFWLEIPANSDDKLHPGPPSTPEISQLFLAQDPKRIRRSGQRTVVVDDKSHQKPIDNQKNSPHQEILFYNDDELDW